MIPFYPDWHYPLSEFYHNTWSADRPNAKYPILTHDDDRNLWNYRTSDNLLVNAAYVRLKNLQFGYTIPKKILAKANIGLSNVRVYVAGTNLFTFTEFKYCDPEMAIINNGYYPQQKNYSVGLNITF